MRDRIAGRGTVMLLAAALVLLSGAAVRAAETDEDIWSDEPPGERLRRGRLGDERIEEFLDWLAEKEPERAKQLRKLQKDEPEKFHKEIQDEFFAQRRRAGENQGGPERRGRVPGDAEDKKAMVPFPPEGPPRMNGSQGERGGRGEWWRERIQRRHEEYIDWLEENFPQEAEKLVALREKDPEGYIGGVMTSRRKYGPIMDAQEKSPELAKVLKEELELKQERDELLEKMRTAEGKQQTELIQRLEKVVNRRFDLIVRKKQLWYEHLLRELERLQKEIKQREAEVEKLKNKKAQFVQERIEELTGKAEKIKWD